MHAACSAAALAQLHPMTLPCSICTSWLVISASSGAAILAATLHVVHLAQDAEKELGIEEHEGAADMKKHVAATLGARLDYYKVLMTSHAWQHWMYSPARAFCNCQQEKPHGSTNRDKLKHTAVQTVKASLVGHHMAYQGTQ